MSVSVVVPCYRSATTLPRLVERVTAVLSEAVTRFEIVLVVDGSPDDTWPVARSLAGDDGAVRAIRLARNYGQHNALVAGIRAARFDVVVTMDDDLQHPPEEIPTLLAELGDDVDLVYGVARDEEHGAVRSLASRTVKSALARTMNVSNAREVSAFRAFRTFLREGFPLIDGPHVCLDVALSWATTRVTSAEVRMDERTEGTSGYTLTGLLRHTANMVLGFSSTPLRLVTYLGFLVGGAGVILFVRLLWMYLTGVTTVAGFTTIAAMVAVFSAAQMIAIGTLGEYVGRIHAGGMGRPTYVVRETVGGERQSEPIAAQRVNS